MSFCSFFKFKCLSNNHLSAECYSAVCHWAKSHSASQRIPVVWSHFNPLHLAKHNMFEKCSTASSISVFDSTLEDATTFCMTTHSIMTLRISDLIVYLNMNDTLLMLWTTLWRIYFCGASHFLAVMLNVIRLLAVMLRVVMLNVVMLSVALFYCYAECHYG